MGKGGTRMAGKLQPDDVWDNYLRDQADETLQKSLDAQQALREAGDPKRLDLDEKARTNLGIELDPRCRKPKPRVFTGTSGEDWVEGRDPPYEQAAEAPTPIAAE